MIKNVPIANAMLLVLALVALAQDSASETNKIKQKKNAPVTGKLIYLLSSVFIL